MSQDWRDFAIEPIEEVLYWMGECIALVYGYKVTPEADGHRWKALKLSGMYCEAFLPSVAPLASLFKLIGDARNNRKYDEEPVNTEIVAKYLSAVTRVWAAFEPDIRRRAAQRQTI